MKKNIHPKYYPDAKVTCNCGAVFTVGSTLPEIKIEICSLCHPLFTGKQKLIDTEGRVERFQKRQQTAQKVKAAKKARDEKKRKEGRKEKQRPRTLKEMLGKTK